MDPLVLKSVKLASSKISNILNNVVCAAETNRITEVLREESFSVYEDETNDRTQEQWKSLVVRYIEPVSLQFRVELLQLVNLDASDCSATKIFGACETALEQKKIPLSNIGLACDNASVMTGTKSSFTTKLLENTPHLITMPCVSHSSAIAAKNSCSTFPDVDYVIELLPSFLNASPKRTAIYRNIFSELRYVFQKISSHCETRWHVCHQCIVVILKNWNVIFKFLMVLESEKVEKAEDLLKKMQDPLIFASFLFLKLTLKALNVFNVIFQKRETMVQQF